MQFHNAVLQGLHERLPSRPGCGRHLQIAQIQFLVGVLVSSTSMPGVLKLAPEYGSDTGPGPPSLEERVAPDSPGRLSAPTRCSPLGRWWPSQRL